MSEFVKGGIELWGPALLNTKLDLSFIETVKGFANEIKHKEELDIRSRLAGKIDNEFSFTDYHKQYILEHFKPIIDGYLYNICFKQYKRTVNGGFGVSFDPNSPDYKGDPNFNYRPILSSCWVNWQKKGEYNPMHNHSGDISFVFYLDVPAELYKEKSKSNGGPPGSIQFTHSLDTSYWPEFSTEFERTKKTLLEPNIAFRYMPYAGQLFMFPSYLHHEVVMFESDVERVSVAGNIILEEDVGSSW